jgi:serine/threonine protein kinase
MAPIDSPGRCTICGFDAATERHALALPLGTLLGERFHIGRVLGKPGGYGITYLAFDVVLESTAAIKEFLPAQIAGRDTGEVSVSAHTHDDDEIFRAGLEEFIREARILVKFSHPNIARVRDFFTANGTGYLVMDYYRGESLVEFLITHKKVLAPARALELMLPILDGLATVHEQGYLHRDIKPSNIYLTEAGVPILLDFGAARQAFGEGTQSLSVIISRGFAPYEQHLRRSHQGPWTDIYAFAATLYYTLTAVRPPDGLERKTEDTLQDAMSINASITPALNAALAHALAVEPDERPQSVAQFRAELDAAIEAGAAPLSSVRRPGIIASKSRVPLIAALTAATIAVLGLYFLLGGWTSIGPEESKPPTAVNAPVSAPKPNRPDIAPRFGRGPRNEGAIAQDIEENAPMPVPAGRPPSAEQQGELSRRPSPPPPPSFAIDACASLGIGDACSFTAPQGVLSGQCFAVVGVVACIPGGPGAPRDRPMRPPPH